MSIAPGWYKDPVEPSTQRWWDGDGWVGEPLPAEAAPPPGPPEPPSIPAVLPPPIPPGAEPPPAAPGIPPGHMPVLPGGPPPRPHGFALAPLGARLVARLVDIGLLFLLNVVANGWFVYQWLQEFGPVVAEAWRRALAGDSSMTDMPSSGDSQLYLFVILFIAAALWFAYEVPAIANTGQTPGKRLLGIRVVRLETDQRNALGPAPAQPTPPPPLGFGRSFRRWNTMGLPTLLWWCGVGFLLQLVDAVYPLFDRPLQQALHDKSANTVVIVDVAAAGDSPTHHPPPSSPKEAPDAPTDPP